MGTSLPHVYHARESDNSSTLRAPYAVFLKVPLDQHGRSVQKKYKQKLVCNSLNFRLS
jgi:hypothetical protein